MPKKWNEDATLVNSLSGNLFDLLPLFPKRVIHVDELVRVHQMPFSHIQILIMLSQGPMSIGQISDRLGIAKPNITPLVDNLRDDGLVERVRSEQDRRSVNVHLLPEGEKRLEAIREDIAKQVTEWRESLSRSEAKELNNALGSIVRIMGTINN